MNNIVNAGAVIIENGKILLIQEAEEPFRGKWNFPLGRIEYGETATTAAVREIKEETGYEVELTHFLGIYQNNPTDEMNVYLVMFVGTPTSGDLREKSEETLGAKWVTLEEMNKMEDSTLFHPEMRNAVKKALKSPQPLNTYINF